ncbi:MAG: hypothetical protein WC518_03170 [Patescibacteria group bacterium]
MNLLFLDQNVFNILGLENLDEAKKQVLLTKLNEVVSDRVSFRLMDEFSEPDQLEFDKLTAKGVSDEEIGQFLNGKVDLQAIILEEVTNFKEQLAGDVAAWRENLK